MLLHSTRILAVAAMFSAVPLLAAAQMAKSPAGAVNPPIAASPATPPSASQSPPAAATAPTGAAANASATTPELSSGLPVKDNTGAQIGQIAGLQTDANGKRMATIKMGSDQFSVDAANLAVENGAAVVNLTQAQIASMLHPAKK